MSKIFLCLLVAVSLCSAKLGDLYFGDYNNGIYKVDSGTTTANLMAGSPINMWQICFDGDGRLWSAQYGGPLYYYDGTWHDAGAGSKTWIGCAYNPKTKKMWAGVVSGTVYSKAYDSTNFNSTGWGTANYRGMCVDSTGRLWMVVGDNGDLYTKTVDSTALIANGQSAAQYRYVWYNTITNKINVSISGSSVKHKNPDASALSSFVDSAKNWQNGCAGLFGNNYIPNYGGYVYKVDYGTTTLSVFINSAKNWTSATCYMGKTPSFAYASQSWSFSTGSAVRDSCVIASSEQYVNSYSSTGLPAGFSIDQATGAIYGTANDTTDATVVVTGKNPMGYFKDTVVVTITGEPIIPARHKQRKFRFGFGASF